VNVAKKSSRRKVSHARPKVRRKPGAGVKRGKKAKAKAKKVRAGARKIKRAVKVKARAVKSQARPKAKAKIAPRAVPAAQKASSAGAAVKLSLSRERIAELDAKVAKSKEIYRQAYGRFDVNDVRMIWSGGKDSTLALWICREFCRETGLPMPRCFTIDEGDCFEEIDRILHDYTAQWNLQLDWGRNDDVLKAANHTLMADVEVAGLSPRNQAEIRRIGMGDLTRFPFEAESYIGNHLMKTVVFNQYVEDNGVKAVYQGLRWDEQAARVKDEYFEDVAAGELTPAHTRIRPILHFSERDVWDATHHYGIPYCPLYRTGYRSLGAKTTRGKLSDQPAWEQDLAATPERAGRRQDKEAAMERLRKLGYM
jgi:phosphoadenosine phosphosulfate reductase